MRIFGRLLAQALPYVPRSLVGLVARRYIAGETLEEGLRKALELGGSGFLTTLDLLGENTTDESQASRALADYRQVLEAVDARGIDGNISVKPTQFGLKLDLDLCIRLFRTLAEEARSLGHFVRVEMEDSSCTDRTLELYRTLRQDFDNVGIVLQSCLHRTPADLESILDLRPDVRIVKGVYVEPPGIAWQDHGKIRDEYVRLSETLIAHGAYVAFATHDEYLIDRAVDIVNRHERAPSCYEFQMLLGVREPLGRQILANGHRLRVYVPFGSDWYPYSMRRLGENPRIAGYVVRAMFGRR